MVPCFQPIAELHTGQLAGFEVLARWQHPQLGLFLPENFISLAEQNGLIDRLMCQVLSKAFLPATLLPQPLILAANVSPIQLLDSTLSGRIRSLAEEAGFPLERLTIEITESALVDNLVQAKSITRDLKAMGCKLAMDDFGTGYSSMRHLQGLPFDKLKVDRSFVASMTKERESRKIVAAVIGLGQSLGLTTIAEGVETAEQADLLQLLGCEMGQGWLYGKPLPAEWIPSMVATAPQKLAPKTAKWVNRDAAATCLEALPTQRLAQLQAIYEGAPVGLCFLDRNFRYVSLSQRLAEMNGAPVAAHIGKTVKEMLPLLFPRVEGYLQRALQGEALADMEILKPGRNSGDPDRTLLASYQPAFDETGEVIGVSVAVADITERKWAEMALRVSEDHYRQMVELSPHVLWVLDSHGNPVEVSSRWVQMTGLTTKQSENEGWLNVLHPADREYARATVRNAIQSASSIDFKFRLKAADGSWRWMRSRGVAHRGASGEVVCWHGIIEDIHDYLTNEACLRILRHKYPSCEFISERMESVAHAHDLPRDRFNFQRTRSQA